MFSLSIPVFQADHFGLSRAPFLFFLLFFFLNFFITVQSDVGSVPPGLATRLPTTGVRGKLMEAMPR